MRFIRDRDTYGGWDDMGNIFRDREMLGDQF